MIVQYYNPRRFYFCSVVWTASLAAPFPITGFFFGAAMRPSLTACLRAAFLARRVASASSRLRRSEGFS